MIEWKEKRGRECESEVKATIRDSGAHEFVCVLV